jgi:hypothetical protein
MATIASPNPLANESFGYAVAISGNTAVAGAPYEKVGKDLSAGYAYAFDASTGALMANFTSPNPQEGGDYGYSVGISGNTVVVGAIGESVGEDALAGRAYVYDNVAYAASAPVPINLTLVAEGAAAAALVVAAGVLAYRSHRTRQPARKLQDETSTAFVLSKTCHAFC